MMVKRNTDGNDEEEENGETQWNDGERRESMKRRKEKLMSLLIDANKKSIPCLSRSR